MAVVGVDACKQGWIAISLDLHGRARGHVVERLDRLLEHVPDAHGVAIDIPMGLPAGGRRQADVTARGFVGRRRSSVFFTPVREALTAPTHAEASSISKRTTGHGISRQAYALAPKILEAERWSAVLAITVWEVHPEVSFAVMLGHPARWPKSTWSGIRERLRALERAGVHLDDIGEAGGRARPDDVVDAAAAAWSAARLHRGEGICLPDPPESPPDAPRPMAIWA